MTIQVIPGLDFPLDAITQKFAWLGRSGSGKSFASRRFVEQLLHAGAQVIVVDTVGVWFGLRSRFEVPILGGLHGDMPLEPAAGELVADIVVEHGSSFVLDTSHFHDAERCRFMTAFGKRLFELKKRRPGAMHVLLDEGQDVVPQEPRPNENLMLHEWVRIAKQGRAFGIGLSITSQRPQEISKKALNQTECVVAFQLTGHHERKALEAWLTDKGIQEQKLGDLLPTLEQGMPFVWSPQWLKTAGVSGKVLPIESADTSSTPTLGEGPRGDTVLRPVNLEKLRAAMTGLAEAPAVEGGNEASLREQVKHLREALAVRKVVAAVVPEALQKIGHAAALDVDSKQKSRDLLDGYLGSLITSLTTLREQLIEILGRESLVPGLVETMVKSFQEPAPEPVPVPLPKKKPGVRVDHERMKDPTPIEIPDGYAKKSPITAIVVGAPMGIPIGESAVLRSICAHADKGATTALLVLETGYRKGSIKSYLERLRTRGLIERIEGKRVRPTEEGAMVFPLAKKRSKDEMLQHYIRTLPAGEGRTLGAVARGKTTLSAIAVAAQCAVGSAKSYTERLATRGLVVRKDGQVTLAPDLKP